MGIEVGWVRFMVGHDPLRFVALGSVAAPVIDQIDRLPAGPLATALSTPWLLGLAAAGLHRHRGLGAFIGLRLVFGIWRAVSGRWAVPGPV